MARYKKTLEKMRANPTGWRISDLDGFVTAFGEKGLKHRRTGSHHHFGFPGVAEICTVVESRPILPIYIKRFVLFVDKVIVQVEADED